MKGAVRLDRSFRHDGIPRLLPAQPRHVEVPKVNEYERFIALREYTPLQPGFERPDTTRPSRAGRPGKTSWLASRTGSARARYPACGEVARPAERRRSEFRRGNPSLRQPAAPGRQCESP